MKDAQQGGQHPEDLPWNDALEDSDAPPGADEPAPAEVRGEGERMRDLAEGPLLGINEPPETDQLTKRLWQEEPDVEAGPSPDTEAELQAPERGGEDVLAAEEERDATDALDEDLPAEEAAVRIREEP